MGRAAQCKEGQRSPARLAALSKTVLRRSRSEEPPAGGLAMPSRAEPSRALRRAPARMAPRQAIVSAVPGERA